MTAAKIREIAKQYSDGLRTAREARDEIVLALCELDLPTDGSHSSDTPLFNQVVNSISPE